MSQGGYKYFIAKFDVYLCLLISDKHTYFVKISHAIIPKVCVCGGGGEEEYATFPHNSMYYYPQSSVLDPLRACAIITRARAASTRAHGAERV